MAALFQEIVAIVEDYLGPASERFVRRQIEFHLEKTPEQLSMRDVGHLADWVRTSLNMLTHDQGMVEECVSRLHHLAIAGVP